MENAVYPGSQKVCQTISPYGPVAYFAPDPSDLRRCCSQLSFVATPARPGPQNFMSIPPNSSGRSSAKGAEMPLRAFNFSSQDDLDLLVRRRARVSAQCHLNALSLSTALGPPKAPDLAISRPRDHQGTVQVSFAIKLNQRTIRRVALPEP